MSYFYYNGNLEHNPVMRRTCHCQIICNECNRVSLPLHLFNPTILNAILLQNYPIVQPVVEYEAPLDVDELVDRVESPISSLQNTRNRSRKPFTIICLTDGNLEPKIPRRVKKLEKGLVKTTFLDPSDGNVVSEVLKQFKFLAERQWRFFECINTSDLRVVGKPPSVLSKAELTK
ncbi:hypothetical protein GLOIN_2v1767937 [Rhizophagus clarus]|uniref:Uncharacterized protein n=1 Tax=Rhizophagus clarus TaxID=94130 RepID=A0A8H3LI25_9GLOM|nr:hypothetical protein GLOIN_2v1767937 [Rhizophagus clarus]